jgi:hypothetical protein
MLADVRRKLAMAVRVWDFFQAHPSDEEAHKALLEQFRERLARADALAVRQRAGAAEERAAVARRKELRLRIWTELLPHLVRVGQVLAIDRPELSRQFQLPYKNSTFRVFRDMTRAMLDIAMAERAAFEGKGLSRTLLDDLTLMFGEFEQASVAANSGRRAHIGARADLLEVTGELVGLVKQLDGLARYRFRLDTGLSAAWKSASDVVGPFGSGPAEEPASEGEPEKPAAGGKAGEEPAA